MTNDDRIKRARELAGQIVIWPRVEEMLANLADALEAAVRERDVMASQLSTAIRRCVAADTESDAARTRLSQVEAERDVLRAEVERWQNCAVCIECGRCKFDEDGCCTTCGRDCLGFIDGKLVRPLADYVDGLERAVAKSATTEAE